MDLLLQKSERVGLLTLGSLGVVGTPFGRPKPLLLLAYLALEGPKDKRFLSELFFPESEGRSSLRQTLSRLRRVGSGIIESDAQRLWTPLVSDAQAFLTALEARDLEQAVVLYRGSFLTGIQLPELGVELEEWVYATREFLAGALRKALLSLAEEAAGLGEQQAATRYAERAYTLDGATDLEPEAFEPLYTLLVAGNSPYAPALRREAEGYNLVLNAPVRTPPPREPPAVDEKRFQLPRPLTRLVGRSADLSELNRLLGEPDVRVLSLLGPGGIGKTRLALEVARAQAGAFSDGAAFLALDLLESPAQLPERLARTLGLEPARAEEAASDVEAFLSDKQLLILLDGAETIVTASAWLTRLLRLSPGLKLLLTTRERFDVAEAWVFPLEGLPVPPTGASLTEALGYAALTLFVQQAKRADLRFDATPGNLAYLIRICELVQGFPLGIALAAAWVKLLAVREIAEEITHNTDLLHASGSAYSERHRSIRAVFESSWQRLSEGEKSALRRLSVFQGGFNREAAASVVGASLPLLARLVDTSLLRVLPGGRYDRHPLLYQLTREKLAENPEEETAARDAHAHFFLTLAETAEPHLTTGEQRVWLDGLEKEHDNLRAALEGCCEAPKRLETGFRLAHALYTFWARHGHITEGRTRLERLLAATGSAATVARANALERAGSLAWLQADYAAARVYLDEALALARRLGAKECLAATLGTLGACEIEEGHYVSGERLFRESLALAEELGDVRGRARIEHNLGTIAHDLGDLEAAQKSFETGLGLFRELGSQHHIAWTLNSLASVAWKQGDVARTQMYAEDAFALLSSSGDPIALAFSYYFLALTAAARDDRPRAHRHHLESLQLQHKAGNKHGLLLAIEGLATFLTDEDVPKAVHLLSAADAARSTHGIPRTPEEQREHLKELGKTQTALGEAAFGAAWSTGQTLGLEDAVAAALEPMTNSSDR